MQTIHSTLILLMQQPRLLVLISLLVVAALIDSYHWRIPNPLTVGGSLVGLLLASMEPASTGLALAMALGGWLAGLVLTLPLYAVGALGGGDVKLFAMVGTFIGPVHMPAAVLLVFITGGVLALLRVMRQRDWWTLWVGGYRRGGASLGRMPYALSICLGSLLYVAVFEPQGLQWSHVAA